MLILFENATVWLAYSEACKRRHSLFRQCVDIKAESTGNLRPHKYKLLRGSTPQITRACLHLGSGPGPHFCPHTHLPSSLKYFRRFGIILSLPLSQVQNARPASLLRTSAPFLGKPSDKLWVPHKLTYNLAHY